MSRPTAKTVKRRWSLTLAIGLSAALTLSACSSNGDAADGDQGDWETVSIDSALGTATIEEEPERIVTLGQGSTETAIALGTTPVGMEEYEWGADDTGYLPWIYDEVKDRDEQLPELIEGSTELDIEAILELEPDLILAPWSGLTQEQYDLLADVAPTVAYPEQPWTIEWQQQIEIIGEAMGEEEIPMQYNREALITKTLSSTPFENGTIAYVSLFHPTKENMLLSFMAELTTPEDQTLVAKPLNPNDNDEVELISPKFNNYYSHRLHSVTVNE